MSEKVTVDHDLQAKLAAGPPVGLCDAAGNVIGVAVTLDQYCQLQRARQRTAMSSEEYDRRSASPNWYTMDDVLRLVEKP